MGFWGWRQATWMAFISVLVVACTETAPLTTPQTNPTPRPVTLTLQGSPGAPPVTPRPTLAALAATPSDDGHPAPIEIEPPICTETLSDGYQCVGIARNITGSAQGTVLLYAELYSGGEIVQTRRIALEQRIVASDSGAPYRVIFDEDADGPLVLAFSESFAPDVQLVSLALDGDSGQMDSADYVLSAALVNPHGFPVYQVRAVVSLYDSARFVGYRVVEVDRLDAGAQVTFDLRWYSLPHGDYRYKVEADAVRGETFAESTETPEASE